MRRFFSASYFPNRGLIAPGLIFAHFDELDMRNFMSKAEFSNIETRVLLSLGASWPSIPLVLSAFHTADEKFSHVPDLTSNLNDKMQTFATVATSSLGVRPSGANRLTQTCIDYVEMICYHQNTRIGSSRITRRIFDAARRFQQTSKFAHQASVGPHCRINRELSLEDRIVYLAPQSKLRQYIFSSPRGFSSVRNPQQSLPRRQDFSIAKSNPPCTPN